MSSSTNIETVTRTIYSAHLMTCMSLHRPFTVLNNSTLNQKFNLFQNEVPGINEYPAIGYIGIGNKGASYDVTSNGFVLTTPIQHLARHASLYNFLPFVVRGVNDDLSSTERLKYRMRVPITVGGASYVAYYLRALTISDVIPTVEIRNVDGETIRTDPFTPTLSDLSPIPPDISNTNINTPNGDYLTSSAKISFTLNQSDIQNILDACNLVYGDPRYAVINEIALVTGIDKVLQGSFGNTTSSYTDVIVAQVAAYISQYHALTTNTTEVSILLDTGSVDGLLI